MGQIRERVLLRCFWMASGLASFLKALALESTADWLFDRDHLAHHVGHTAFVLRGSSISIVAGCYYIAIFGA